MEYIKNHSLSLFCITSGLIVMAFSGYYFQEGILFDLVSGTGQGIFSAGLIYLLSGPLKETNKPEED